MHVFAHLNNIQSPPDGCPPAAPGSATPAGAYTHAEYLSDIPLAPLVGNVTLKASSFSATNTANVTGLFIAVDPAFHQVPVNPGKIVIRNYTTAQVPNAECKVAMLGSIGHVDCKNLFSNITINTRLLDDTKWHKLFIRTDAFVSNGECGSGSRRGGGSVGVRVREGSNRCCMHKPAAAQCMLNVLLAHMWCITLCSLRQEVTDATAVQLANHSPGPSLQMTQSSQPVCLVWAEGPSLLWCSWHSVSTTQVCVCVVVVCECICVCWSCALGVAAEPLLPTDTSREHVVIAPQNGCNASLSVMNDLLVEAQHFCCCC